MQPFSLGLLTPAGECLNLRILQIYLTAAIGACGTGDEPSSVELALQVGVTLAS